MQSKEDLIIELEQRCEQLQTELADREKRMASLQSGGNLRDEFLSRKKNSSAPFSTNHGLAFTLMLFIPFFYLNMWPSVKDDFSVGVFEGLMALAGALFMSLCLFGYVVAMIGLSGSLYNRLGYVLDDEGQAFISVRWMLVASWILLVLTGYSLGHYGMLDGIGGN